LAHPERSFGLGAPSPPAALPPTSPPGAHRRDFGLRLALYAIVLGAVLTMVTAFVLARQDALVGVDAAGFATYHRVLVPLLAVAAIAGVLLVERVTLLGLALLLAGLSLTLAAGGQWLAPGVILACVWAARHRPVARIALGFLLLVPGIAAGYFGILGSVSFFGQVSLDSLPMRINPPLTLAQALTPFAFLPLALLGAWLLLWRPATAQP